MPVTSVAGREERGRKKMSRLATGAPVWLFWTRRRARRWDKFLMTRHGKIYERRHLCRRVEAVGPADLSRPRCPRRLQGTVESGPLTKRGHGKAQKSKRNELHGAVLLAEASRGGKSTCVKDIKLHFPIN